MAKFKFGDRIIWKTETSIQKGIFIEYDEQRPITKCWIITDNSGITYSDYKRRKVWVADLKRGWRL